MRRILVLLFQSLLFILHTNAQTFYEVLYEQDGEEVLGLMKYSSDEDCQMRFVTAGSIAKHECWFATYRNYAEGKQSADDVNMMIYYPIKDGKEDVIDEDRPAFVWVWEKDDASDLSDMPYYTYDIEDEKSYKEVKYFREIKVSDMDEEYVSQFYGTDEPEYRQLVNAIVVTHASSGNVTPGSSAVVPTDTPAPTTSEGSKLHLLIVANTEVSDIGLACKKDLDNLNSEFQGIARVLGMQFAPNYIMGDNYSKQNVQQLVRDFRPSKDDVVVFMYTGHGWRYDDQTDIYPNMDLCPTSYDNPVENYLNFSDVANEICSRGARLSVVLSDCCNAKIGITLSMLNSNSLFARTNNNFDAEKLRKLFLGSKGTVVATAASPGEKSYCNANGGFFTVSFLESLRNGISALSTKQPSWEDIINNTISSAAVKSNENHGSATQNGIKKIRINQ